MGETKSLEPINLADGRYFGKWCAYYVTIHLPEWVDKPVKLNNGIRGMSTVIVIVKDGWVYVGDEKPTDIHVGREPTSSRHLQSRIKKYYWVRYSHVVIQYKNSGCYREAGNVHTLSTVLNEHPLVCFLRVNDENSKVAEEGVGDRIVHKYSVLDWKEVTEEVYILCKQSGLTEIQ